MHEFPQDELLAHKAAHRLRLVVLLSDRTTLCQPEHEQILGLLLLAVRQDEGLGWLRLREDLPQYTSHRLRLM